MGAIIAAPERGPSVLTLTTDSVPGRRVEPLGLVSGAAFISPGLAGRLVARLGSAVGGHVSALQDRIDDARAHSLAEMEREAKDLGADAIVGCRFTFAQTGAGAVQVLAFGTAARWL